MSRLAIAAGCAFALGCRKPDPGPALQIVDETTIVRRGDTVPDTSAIFDGKKVSLVAAKGETVGLLVYHREAQPVTLAGARGFAVDDVHVASASSKMYGPSRGKGDYPDGLTPSDAPASDPAYFEITADTTTALVMKVAGKDIPVELTVKGALPPLPRTVWAYEDPRELVWAGNPGGERGAPSGAEAQCIDLFAAHGVLLSPDLRPELWNARKAQFAGLRDVPVIIPEDPASVGKSVTEWLAAMPDHQPFAIPIDEPRKPDARRKVRALADAIRAVDPTHRFHLAVTDAPDPIYGDAVDLYISSLAPHLEGDKVARWTYNGNPPYAGNMTVDAVQPALRTWGWIAWRYNIPLWYAWDALYWHDRHNRHGAPLPGKPMDGISFDDGEDHGSLDGVLAMPGPGGCRPTLRLKQLRRGLEDRALLDAAARCHADAAKAIAAQMIPRALGDASGDAAWPADPNVWEQARAKLVDLNCP